MIKLVDVTKSYFMGNNRVDALKGVSFTVRRGELVAIMGASGCGKSTTMNIIGLLDKPTGGQYYLNEQEISTLSNNQLADLRNKSIGFVFQSFFLLPRFNALQNVGLPLTYRHLSTDEIRARALSAMKKVSIEHLADNKPNQMSGGQQQRVAIARALVGEPDIILADEPTGALDSRTSEEVMNLLVTLNKQEQVTVIVVTHDPLVAKRCNRVLEMKDGVIATDC